MPSDQYVTDSREYDDDDSDSDYDWDFLDDVLIDNVNSWKSQLKVISRHE